MESKMDRIGMEMRMTVMRREELKLELSFEVEVEVKSLADLW